MVYNLKGIYLWILASVVLIFLQSCSTTDTSSYASVTTAYETSGLLNLKPYKRTIFSSSDF